MKMAGEPTVPHPADRLFWFCLAIYMAVLPISSTIALRNIGFLGMIVATLWAVSRGGLRLRFPAANAWLPYAVVALLSLVWAVDFSHSLGEIRTEIGYAALVCVLSASWINGLQQLRRLAWISIVCNAAMVAYSAYLVAVTPGSGNALIGSFRTATGTYSTYLITFAPLLLFMIWDTRRKGQTAVTAGLSLLLAMNLLALWFTANRQGIIAYAAEVIILALLELRVAFDWRKVSTVAAIFAVFVALFGTQQHKRTGAQAPLMAGIAIAIDDSKEAFDRDVRWQLWKHSIDQIAHAPWHGDGFGREAFLAKNTEYYRSHPQLWHAHNMLLNKGIQMGVPGMLAFLVMWIGLGMTIWRTRHGDPVVAACAAALLLGVFVKNMTDDFFVDDNALMFWLYVGGMLSTLRTPTAPNCRA